MPPRHAVIPRRAPAGSATGHHGAPLVASSNESHPVWLRRRIRRHRRRRRPRGHRGRGRGRAARRAHGAGDERARDHRPDVVQSGHRRRRQGHRRARGRRARRHHGSRDRPGHGAVPDAQPRQGAGGVGAACAVRPRAVPARRALAAGGATRPRDDAGHRRAARVRRSARRGSRDAGGAPARRARGRRHDRHLPARADPHRHDDGDGRRPRGRGRHDAPRRAARGGRPGDRAVQDGHAAAHRRSQRRPAGARGAAERDGGLRLPLVALRDGERSPRRCRSCPAGSPISRTREGRSSRRTSARAPCTAARSRRAARATAPPSRTRSSSFPTLGATSSSSSRKGTTPRSCT